MGKHWFIAFWSLKKRGGGWTELGPVGMCKGTGAVAIEELGQGKKIECERKAQYGTRRRDGEGTPREVGEKPGALRRGGSGLPFQIQLRDQ